MMRITAIHLAVCAGAFLLPGCRMDGPDARQGFWSGTAPQEVARGNARRGPWQQNESDFDYVDDPAVALSGDGQLALAWVDQASRGIRLQSYDPAGTARFASPVRLSDDNTFSWMPRLAFAPDDPARVHVLWQEIVFSGGGHGGEIFHARSLDGGATFGAPVNLSNSLGGDGKGRLTRERWDNGSLDLAVGPGGFLVAAWTEYEGRLLVSHSQDGGRSFPKVLHVSGGDASPARAPSLALDEAGVVHLAWSENCSVLVAASGDGGRSFSPARAVPSQGHADAPQLAADGRGSLHLVFSESPTGLGGPSQIRYARRQAGESGFSSPRIIAAADDGTYSVGFSEMTMAGATLHIAWKRYAARGQRAQGVGYARSVDAGQSFSAPEVVSGSDDPASGASGSLQGSLLRRLAGNAKGDLALADSTFAPGSASRIRLWRRR